MENKKNLFSITDNGGSIDIKCEGEGAELVRVFSSLIKSSDTFKTIIEVSLDMANRDVDMLLQATKHEESITPNKEKWDA
jgi:hypothetical protein